MKSHTELLKIIEELTNDRHELQYKIDEQGDEIHALRQRITSLEALNDKQRQTLKGRSYKSHKCTCERVEVKPEVFRMKYYKPKGK